MFRLNRSDLLVTAALGVVALLLVAFYAWPWQAEPAPSASLPSPAATLPPAGESLTTTSTGALSGAVTGPVAMPGDRASAEAARGATFVEAVAAGAELINPVLAVGATAERVAELIYPRLLDQDPSGGFITPSALAEGWEVSPDGRVYTFTLRSGVHWSDGQPVTAADVKFTYDALASETVASPYRDRAAAIERMETPDAHTLVVTLRSPSCSALHRLRRPLLPAHRYAADFSDLATNALNHAPEVGAGPFLFAEQTPGEQIMLVRNPDYWKGAPQIERYVLAILPDAAARRQALEEGRVDLASLEPAELIEDGLPAGAQLTVYPYQADAYSVLALNLADPANPQPGMDGAGQAIPQPPHPILGDAEVRQAIAEALDYEALLAEGFQGRGYRLTGYVLPTVGWAYADLPRVAHDPARAGQRLADAGWVDGDGDGIREAGGETLRLALQTNGDNPLRVRLAEQVAAQLQQVGFQIDLEVVSFEELADMLLGQRFDLAVIGWENVGADPGNAPFWQTAQDRPGQGFNFTSFQDPEV
ncbi:MAG TPA: peptide ABC transporter substrate-binding protein, partial [Caldilineaceae bacterium]|nr:peptide ABC transporter substrate-binding protein [Caldilineaceae bacterium]